MAYKYKAFGLTFESEKEIPNLPSSSEQTDVTIRFDKLPDTLGEDSHKKPFYEALDSTVLLKLKRFGKIYQENGNNVIIDINERVTTIEDIHPYLFGSVIGSIAHQKGLLPLHTSAINYKGKAILFSGRSGAGKSSIAVEFNKRGFDIISDDTILVNKREDGSFFTYPGVPEIKLWLDIGEKYPHLGTNKVQILDKSKYRYNLPVKHFNTIYDIVRLYKINPISDKDIEINDVKPLQKINIINDVTYRRRMGHFTGNTVTHFKMAAEFANKITIKAITRPRLYVAPEKVVDVLLKDIEKDFGNE